MVWNICALDFRNVNTIKNSLKLFEISGTTICVNEDYKLYTTNYAAFNQAIYDVRWTNFLFTESLIYKIFKILI